MGNFRYLGRGDISFPERGFAHIPLLRSERRLPTVGWGGVGGDYPDASGGFGALELCSGVVEKGPTNFSCNQPWRRGNPDAGNLPYRGLDIVEYGLA